MTSKPISTISYNTEPFLKEVLDEWVKSHIIQCYQYIKHVGEDGDKDHIHLRIEPNKKLDPMDLTDSLLEFVDGYGGLPLGIRPWRPSHEEDWYLYVVHDPEYLKIKYGGGDKGEKLPYKVDDIVVSEYYDLNVAFIRAKQSLEHSQHNLAARLRSGVEPYQLLLDGENVFTVNAITNLITKNDYSKLVKELNDTTERLQSIERAIKLSNMEIVQDPNTKCLRISPILKKYTKNIK